MISIHYGSEPTKNKSNIKLERGSAAGRSGNRHTTFQSCAQGTDTLHSSHTLREQTHYIPSSYVQGTVTPHSQGNGEGDGEGGEGDGEGDGTRKMEMERTGNECPNQCPVEKGR